MTHWREFLDPSGPSGGYLAWKEVARRTSLSRTTAWRLQKRDEFPRAHPISPGRVGHLEREVEAWIASRAAPGEPQIGPSAARAAARRAGCEASRSLPVAAQPAVAGVSETPSAPPVRKPAPSDPGATRRGRRSKSESTRQIMFEF